MLYTDEKSIYLGEMKEKKKRKVERKNERTVLLLCLTSSL